MKIIILQIRHNDYFTGNCSRLILHATAFKVFVLCSLSDESIFRLELMILSPTLRVTRTFSPPWVSHGLSFLSFSVAMKRWSLRLWLMEPEPRPSLTMWPMNMSTSGINSGAWSMVEGWGPCGTCARETTMWSSASKFSFNFCWGKFLQINSEMLCLRCEEREKGWNITSTLTFYEKGMINERVFHNDNISKFDQQSKIVNKHPHLSFSCKEILSTERSCPWYWWGSSDDNREVWRSWHILIRRRWWWLGMGKVVEMLHFVNIFLINNSNYFNVWCLCINTLLY